MKRANRSPIIILGMHRSGTSMVTRMLEALGLFVGNKLQGDHEAVFFRRLNDWLLQQSGAAWDHPQPVQCLAQNASVRRLAGDYLRLLSTGPRAISYLGPAHYLRARSLFQLDFPWGWKEPRNTFTLPIWLDLFPDAKIVHIYRHGVDVANSLQVRHHKQLEQDKQRFEKNAWLYRFGLEEASFSQTLRCASLEGGFSLWEEYFREARAHVKSLGGRALEVKYETFLEDSHTSLKTLAEFCDLDISEPQLGEIADGARASRAYAYRNNSHLSQFAQSVASRLQAFGYE